MRTSSARASPTPARTTAWAPTRRRRRSCRSSSARSSRTSSSSWSRAPRPPPSTAATWSSGPPRCRSCPRTPRTATGPRRSPSPATSSSSARSARRRPIYWPQTVLNTAVADSLEQLADALDGLEPSDFDGLTTILSGIVQDNKQVLFGGNGYSEEWHAEAERRGLPNNRTTVDALPALDTPKAKDLFSKFGVLSERELSARLDINWERYVKVAEHRGELRPRHRLDDDPAGHRPLPRRAEPGTVVARHQRDLREGHRARRHARRRHRGARARPARGPRGGLRPGRGAASS